MAFCDFVVKYDPEKDTPEELTKRILYSIIIKRLKAHKPCVCFVGGDSGEGKSKSVLRLQQLLLEIYGLRLQDYLQDINVFTPLEYPKKLDGLLFNKRLKKLDIICMHEAREVVKAKNWQSFLTQSISDVNAMSRSIKRLCIFVISQFIRDITNDIRYTLNYYMIVRRPKGKKARLYINVLWKDDRDLEKPKLRKRKLSGYLVGPDGRYRRYVPQYLEMNLPPREICEEFDRLDTEAKAAIIRRKLDRLIEEMKADVGEQNEKVEKMLEYYAKNVENLHLVGRQLRGKWRLHPDARKMHDLTEPEAEKFERLINERLQKKGLIHKVADEHAEIPEDPEEEALEE